MRIMFVIESSCVCSSFLFQCKINNFVEANCWLFSVKTAICAAGSSTAYGRTAAFGDDVVIVA